LNSAGYQLLGLAGGSGDRSRGVAALGGSQRALPVKLLNLVALTQSGRVISGIIVVYVKVMKKL